jgi:hypothetical protein
VPCRLAHAAACPQNNRAGIYFFGEAFSQPFFHDNTSIQNYLKFAPQFRKSILDKPFDAL